MVLWPNTVLAVVLELTQGGIFISLLCMFVIVFLVLFGVILLLLLLKGAFKPQHVDSFDYSLTQGREVAIRHQDDDPVHVTQENQSQPKKETDWELSATIAGLSADLSEIVVCKQKKPSVVE
jgi:hypothetical protein